MKKTIKAFGIVYVFFLVTLVLLFGGIILNKQSYFEKKIIYTQIQDILSKNILFVSDLSLDYHQENNDNAGLYIPVLSCPNDVEIFSGAVLISTGKTFFQDNACTGILNNENLLLFYSGGYNTFSSGTLGGNSFELSQGDTLSGTFSQYEIYFDKPNIFDDRFVKARIQMQGIIFMGIGYQNIFWNNSKINNFIDSNTHNISPYVTLGNTLTGVLYLDVADSFSGKIIQFDKQIFDTKNKLLKLEEIDFSHSGGVVGYLQNDLSFSGGVGNSKIFDFKNNDYAIFLAYNTGSLDNIRYTLKVFTDTGTGVYINPIKDDGETFEYLGNTLFMKDGQIYYKIQKIIR